jgi:RNA polymerase sigma-70 factor (ECF subfamily)
VLVLAEATDLDLIRAGDIARLADRYYGQVFGLARRLLGDASLARDAAQETFVRAIAHLREFNPELSFRSWLFAIAANHVRDLLRRSRPLAIDPALEEELPDLSLPDDRLLRTENQDRLRAAVERLAFELKIVVTLHFQQDLPYAEIATALGISVNAVRIRLYRALGALRKELS